MKTDERILSEIKRYNSINNYIMEQDALDAPDLGAEPTPAPDLGGAPADAPVATPADTKPQIIDVKTDTDVQKIDNKGESEETDSSTEELDITDLVDSQKKIESKQEEYFQNLFGQLENLQSKLGEMDGLVQKLNDIETKLEKYRQKTPEEKLELRTLDSGPYNQKLTDYFSDKLPEMEKQGKEYVLTTDDVQSFSPNEIKKTFASELPSMNARNYNNN
jgi:hypothetical protein